MTTRSWTLIPDTDCAAAHSRGGRAAAERCGAVHRELPRHAGVALRRARGRLWAARPSSRARPRSTCSSWSTRARRPAGPPTPLRRPPPVRASVLFFHLAAVPLVTVYPSIEHWQCTRPCFDSVHVRDLLVQGSCAASFLASKTETDELPALHICQCAVAKDTGAHHHLRSTLSGIGRAAGGRAGHGGVFAAQDGGGRHV